MSLLSSLFHPSRKNCIFNAYPLSWFNVGVASDTITLFVTTCRIIPANTFKYYYFLKPEKLLLTWHHYVSSAAVPVFQVTKVLKTKPKATTITESYTSVCGKERFMSSSKLSDSAHHWWRLECGSKVVTQRHTGASARLKIMLCFFVSSFLYFPHSFTFQLK